MAHGESIAYLFMEIYHLIVGKLKKEDIRIMFVILQFTVSAACSSV
jgi:hypothetical protein